MGYNLINWENSPSKQTPINAENLNQMDVNIAKAIQGTRFNISATFTSDGVLKNTTSTDALGAGSFATSQTDIVTVFVADNVTKINNGAFSGCTSLKTIYIDNTVGNVDIVSGAVPSGVSIVYSNDDNFINVNELLASTIRSLKKQVNADKSDWESRATSIEEQASSDKSELSQAIQGVKESALEEFANVKADVSTNEKSIESLKADKLDKADFNAYKTATDKAIADNTESIKANTTAIDKCVTDIAINSALINQNSIKATTDKSTSVVLNDSSDCNIVGLTLYGKSTQSAVPSPTNPVDINSVENPSITFSNKKSSQNLQLNYILRGVDNICDVLTINSDGTGFITEKLQQLVLLSSDFDNLKENPSGTNTHRCTLTLSNSTQWANSSVKYAPLCNVLQFFAFAGTEKYPCFDIRTNTLYVDLGLSLNDTKATLKNCADENNGIVLVGVKQTSTVLNLTKEQINEFLNLHTYYPSTTVVSECDSQLTYIADTKNYIDNKFNELATAIVAHESEVM